MPYLPHSVAAIRTSMSIPAFDTQYAPMSRSASVPLMLDTATIDPPDPESIIVRATARMVSQVPVRLVSMTRCQSLGLWSNNIPDAPMPAQATSRFGAP